MTARPGEPLEQALVRRLAVTLSFVYPSALRHRARHEFGEVAVHRLSIELQASGQHRAALWRTVWLLLTDTAAAAPAAWRSHLTGPGNRPSLWRQVMFWITDAVTDVRLALRACLRQPLFAVCVVGTLGLGIGASAASFAALNRVVLKPLAFPDGDRLAFVTMHNVSQGWRFVPAPPVLERWRATATMVEQFEGYQPTSATYLGGSSPEVLDAANVSPGLTAMLRLKPVLGRTLGPTDVSGGSAPAVMISERFWHERFGGARDVLTRSIHLGATTYAIAGVWPQAARINPREQPDVFFVRPEKDVMRASSWSFVVAKLRPGITMAAAENDLASQLTGVPGIREGMRPSMSPPTEFLGKAYVRGLWLVFGAAVMLMVVGVANAANLLLARAASRARELSVRLALGGSVWRLARMFFVEGAVLSSAGGVLAIGMAWATGRVLAKLADGDIPPDHFLGLDASVYLFAAGGAAVASFLCAIVPVLQARRSNLLHASASNDLRVVGTTSRTRQTLVAIQAAVGVVLVAGAVLMSRSLTNLTSFDVGFAVHELVTFSVSLPASRYPTAESQAAFMTQVRDAVTTIPGVTGVVTSGMPLFRQSVQDGQPYLDGEAPPVGLNGETTGAGAAPGYFDVMGIPLRQGRVFQPDEKSGVVVVNESFAQMHGGAVVGRRLYQPREGMTHEQLKPELIVGVVGDVRSRAMSTAAEMPVQIYRPSPDHLEAFTRFMLRTNADPGGVLRTVRTRVAALDPMLPLLAADTGTTVFRAETSQHRFVAALLAGLAMLGVALAVAGVYGAVSIEVRRRTREVGLRVALGATRSQVLRLMVDRGMRPVLIGAVAGLVGWWWAAGLLDALLFRIDAHDPASAVLGCVGLLLVALAACVWPARRGSRVDPAITLRVN